MTPLAGGGLEVTVGHQGCQLERRTGPGAAQSKDRLELYSTSVSASHCTEPWQP